MDAMVGYSLRGAPWGKVADLIQMANQSVVPILSLDETSGIVATRGKAFDPHILAVITPTLVLPKIGLLEDTTRRRVGVLYLADISMPVKLNLNLGLQIGPIFSESEIIRV